MDRQIDEEMDGWMEGGREGGLKRLDKYTHIHSNIHKYKYKGGDRRSFVEPRLFRDRHPRPERGDGREQRERERERESVCEREKERERERRRRAAGGRGGTLKDKSRYGVREVGWVRGGAAAIYTMAMFDTTYDTPT